MACREDARQIIKRVMGCTQEDAVIFVGSGSTSAANLLVSKLKIKARCDFFKLQTELAEVLPPESLFKTLAKIIPAELDSKTYC